ncbi:MAG: AAA family ATPase [Pseudomonas sp.]|uniref:AAA family ATPase n=1 Tax=Pseudomonas sp. TaxID=306 RepID=UPI00271949F1|nr:AAA family ATPase [Pseudomonas sp.]MDO8405171.1 AAA family ATPase [Pseudomonas sp.]
MSGIYLSKVKIKDFRTFGNFEISLPSGPGLTLITGTNGLGKSSFFDAIEWGLTGKIRRFERYNKNIEEDQYLPRRGALAGSHQVELGFSDGTTFARGSATSPESAAIIECLKNSEWGPVNDLGTYLAFTHFLGQAAQQRFTSREGHEQWSALKGPSGIERLEEVRQGLRGRSTQLAFTKRIDQEQNLLEDIQRQLAEWQGWSARLERLQQAASASGAHSPEELKASITELEREIGSITTVPLVVLEGASYSLRLNMLSKQIEETQRELFDRRDSLESIGALPGRYVSLMADAQIDGPVLTSALAAVGAARVLVAEGENASISSAVIADKQAKVVAAIKSDVELLELARHDLERKTQLEPLISVVKKDLRELLDLIGSHRSELTKIDQAIAYEGLAKNEQAQAQAVFDAACQIVGACANLKEIEASAASSVAAYQSALQESTQAINERESLIESREELVQQLGEADVALDAARRRSGEIEAAVARIALHIHEDDTVCPVCTTPFERGELRLIINAASSSVDAELVLAQASVENLNSDLRSLDHQIYQLDEIIEQVRLAKQRAQADAAKVDDIRRTISASLHVESTADLFDVSAANYTKSQSIRIVADEKLREASVATAGIRARQLVVNTELDAMVERQDYYVERMSVLEGELRNCSERLVARDMAGADAADLTARLGGEQVKLEAALKAQRLLDTVAEKAAADLITHRTGLTAAEQVLDQASSARKAAEQSAADIRDQWMTAGFELSPSEAGLEAARVATLSTLGHLDQIASRLSVLARENEATLLQQEIEVVRAAMSAAAGSDAVFADQVQYEAVLKERVKSARDALKLSKSTKVAVNKFTTGLKKEAIDFSTQFLVPLNRVIDDFNEAMLSAPGETIRFNAEHRVDATRFEMKLHSRDRIDNATLDKSLPPQIVLSEGQIAANGFSILCAASTAYPWSRWRALLLDDPLQHNDIIHTAAFVDVMRNMVELKGYQLIMSSPDRAESEFIARKFDAAGLPCSTVALTAPSASGVQYDETSDNRVAARTRWNAMRQ